MNNEDWDRFLFDDEDEEEEPEDEDQRWMRDPEPINFFVDYNKLYY